MNKGILEMDFEVLKNMLIKEYPQLKDTQLNITCADVDNFKGRIKAQYITDKPIEGLSYEVNDIHTDVWKTVLKGEDKELKEIIKSEDIINDMLGNKTGWDIKLYNEEDKLICYINTAINIDIELLGKNDLSAVVYSKCLHMNTLKLLTSERYKNVKAVFETVMRDDNGDDYRFNIKCSAIKIDRFKLITNRKNSDIDISDTILSLKTPNLPEIADISFELKKIEK